MKKPIVRKKIPVAAPALTGNEARYVLDCVESGWISSIGEYVERFEGEFARFCGVDHAVSCCNGTAALHLALMALGVGPGDEVIVPALTFVATANAVTYCGAKPVFADSEPDSWVVNPLSVERKISSRTRGIIAVHLYGHPAEMDALRDLAARKGLFLVEDAAEAHGAEHKGRRVGGLGDVGVFSFYGNKILTTGEGGMLVTNEARLASSARLLRGQGMDPGRRYWFPIIGYNYRMTNIAAAIGLAQLEKVEWHLSRRREVARWYREKLREVRGVRLQAEMPWAKHAYWMVSICLEEEVKLDRDAVMMQLADMGIETRPLFYPMHKLPMYREPDTRDDLGVAEWLSARGLNVPTSALIEAEDVDYIVSSLLEVLS